MADSEAPEKSRRRWKPAPGEIITQKTVQDEIEEQKRVWSANQRGIPGDAAGRRRGLHNLCRIERGGGFS